MGNRRLRSTLKGVLIGVMILISLSNKLLTKSPDPPSVARLSARHVLCHFPRPWNGRFQP